MTRIANTDVVTATVFLIQLSMENHY